MSVCSICIAFSGSSRDELILTLPQSLLRNPSVLIRDETTSTLDVQNESCIQQSLERLSGRLTIIVIAHSQSAIVNTQQVVVFEQGRIVNRGTYHDLVQNEGEFRNLLRVA